MKNILMISISVVFTLAFLIGGCKDNNSTEPLASDKDAMTEIIANDAFFNLDNIALNDGDPSALQSTSLRKITTGIIPFNWGRKIQSINRTVVFTEISDTTASAVVTHSWSGLVWIRGIYTPQDTSYSIIKKSITETIKRNVKFVRKDRDSNPRKNWKISEISVLAGGTANSDLMIQKVVFYIDSDTLEITNPLDYFFKVEQKYGSNGLHSVPPGINREFKVQVTLSSTDPDSDFVVAHRPVWVLNNGVYRRNLMTLVSSTLNNNSFTRVYELSWQGAWAGKHHVMIGVITRRSIFDDLVPFSSQLWGIPYVVE
jgi:PBP1b-binding outer membrane lipoprotein LpoB